MTLLLAGCDPAPDVGAHATTAEPGYTHLDQQLQPLRDDFNAAQGKVRMVFLSGPSCAVCLRGLADMQTALMTRIEGDARYEVFVVHVPALGATEEHAQQSLPLLQGSNVRHYWDGPGLSGRQFQELFEVDFYVWDWWAIFDPQSRWDGLLPPEPVYWEHQLASVWPEDRYLDAERFAGVALKHGDGLGRHDGGAEPGEAALTSGVELVNIFQGQGMPIRTYHNGRGGYRNLKRIQRIESSGEITTPAGDRHTLSLIRDRDTGYVRTVDGAAAGKTPDGVMLPEGERGLPDWVERVLLESYEFDGFITEWKDKGHELSMPGMETFGDELNWVLRVRQRQGFDWRVLLDTREGDLISARLLDERGAPRLEIREVAHETVDGFRFPTELVYLDGDGTEIAREYIHVDDLVVAAPAGLDETDIRH